MEVASLKLIWSLFKELSLGCIYSIKKLEVWNFYLTYRGTKKKEKKGIS